MFNERKKITISISAFLLYVAIGCYFSFYFINNSYFREFFNISLLYKIIYLSTTMLLIGSICMAKKMQKKMFLLYLITASVSCYVGLKSDDLFTLIIIILFMIAGNKKEIEKILKVCFCVNITWLILIVLSAKVGFIQNVSVIRVGRGIRTYLGFTAHVAPIVLMYCCLMYISYKKKDVKIWQLFLIELFNLFLYSNASVRASFWMTNIVVVLAIALKRIDVKKIMDLKRIQKIVILILPISIMVTVMLPILYSKGVTWTKWMDSFLSGRIRLEMVAMQNYDINLFGQLIQFNYGGSGTFDNSRDYFYLDSSYLKYAYMYGLILVGIVVYCYHKMIQAFIQKKDIYLLLAVIVEVIYFSTGAQLFNVVYNPFLIVLLNYTMREKRKFACPVGVYYNG